MKTIAFHSYKGGVGRTMALVNFALALQKQKKQVLLIDLDFGAPGLLNKFDLENEIDNKGGYVDYVLRFGIEGRLDDTLKVDRVNELKNMFVKVELTNIKILPIGNPQKIDYWHKLALLDFYKNFTSLGAQLPYASSKQEDRRWQALKQDMEDIKEAAGVLDFVLIDSKSAYEHIAIPFFAWSDQIVEFFHCNSEGILGALMVKELVNGAEEFNTNISEDKNKLKVPGIVPVVTRTPSYLEKEEVVKHIGKLVSRYKESYSNEVNLLDEENLFIVSEMKELLVSEKIILRETLSDKKSNDGGIDKISYDYKALFNFLSEGVADSFDIHDEDMLVDTELFFQKNKGILINTDNKSNVSFRRESIATIFDQIGDAIEDRVKYSESLEPSVSKLFFEVGVDAGKVFGKEIWVNKSFWGNNIPKSKSEKIDRWIDFDRNAGFGEWSGILHEENSKGQIKVENHFLSGARYGINFVEGYVNGVLSFLLADTVNSPVRVSTTTDSKAAELINFEFFSK